jgi:hypothetical protein
MEKVGEYSSSLDELLWIEAMQTKTEKGSEYVRRRVVLLLRLPQFCTDTHISQAASAHSSWYVFSYDEITVIASPGCYTTRWRGAYK